MSVASFFLLGASHQTAPLELREKLALAGDKLEALCGELHSLAGLGEFAVLNTCNRVEVYGVAAQAETVSRVQSALCTLSQLDAAAFARARLELRDQPAVQHLLEVAAGIDSQMIGETEILGQVKEAYAAAQARGTTGPVLNRVFQKTFQAAKHVRTNTAIGEGRISVSSVAVDLALKIFGDLRRCRVLAVGAGEIGEKTARAFRSREVGEMAVTSRNFQHAETLARDLGAQTVPFDRLAESLPHFDIVVCSTAAPVAIVTPATAALVMRRRAVRPLFFIDLAMPRNIEPGVADLPNAFLYNLDDLAKISEENRALRQAEIEWVRVLLAEKAGALWRQVELRMSGNQPAT